MTLVPSLALLLDMASLLGDKGAPFANWLAAKVESLNLDADIYGEYVTGILSDEDSGDSLVDRAVAAAEILSGAFEGEEGEGEPLLGDAFIPELPRRWEARTGTEETPEGDPSSSSPPSSLSSPSAAAAAAAAAARQKVDLEMAVAAAAERKAAMEKRVNISGDERRERERLLGTYGQVDAVVDEDGNVSE